MNWSDEKYVKLYVRQTATWRMWPWQARCVFPLLLQVANGAGLLDVGGKDPLTGLSVLIMVPREVVELAVAALLEDGTLERVTTGFLIPKFLEAQEATKTEARKKADQRERERAKARVTTQPPVTECPVVSPGVTECPPPAQPSPAQPSPKKLSTASRSKPNDAHPEHQATIDAMALAFTAERGAKYPFSTRDAGAVRRMLKGNPPEVIKHAWVRALREARYPPMACIYELEPKLAHFVGTGPPAGNRSPAPVADWSNAVAGEIPA